ncbi:Flp family type IVb pilin [Microvirga tunisiensis]|uniref:Flp family type IVb pilin n=2 Tax=Pannonibacter tanglangensis TaxID=2750084 RepID=A0ABW9ZM79_9HYPH|nr:MULTISPECIES: Flp family type IVb pilin [unclassified Pannonibacter]NBN66025.1 Flp family type IVb pilin [Pannonibacter sp. XCT-34]NBN80520.1 Flp family type IVb pilin [Pannonibacter sp. XCT-53]
MSARSRAVRPLGRFRSLARRFLSDERGTTMVEYGLLVAMISLAIVTTLMVIRDEILNDFTTIADTLKGDTLSK